MVKDRLQELKQFQNKNGTNKNEVIEIESNNTQSTPENESRKLRQTFERAEVIGQWIEQIEKNNQDVRIFLRRIEDMQFSQKDNQDKLQSLFQNNTSLAHQISNKLKEVDEELKNIQTESTERRIKNIQYTTSKKRFEKAFLDNNQLLENYRNTQKHLIKSQLVAKGYFNVTDEEVSLLLEEGTDIQVFTENILAETAEAKRVLADVEERHQQLLKIERMLTEVRDLFVQMSIVIDSQQELIDRIEYQAQTAVDAVGAVDLKSVRKSKKKYLRRKIYIIIAVIVLLLIILILVFK